MSEIHSGVNYIVNTLIAKKITHIFISPGSRNAPLSLAFARSKKFNLHISPDERAAAYMALGMAQQLQQPVVIVCTSGTAALNYTPAIAEAFHMEIPLIILTADRPEEWLHQIDSQMIDQKAIFKNFCIKWYQFPKDDNHNDTCWHQKRIINEAIELSSKNKKGPVHINVPLREPLYNNTYKQINESDLTLTELSEVSATNFNNFAERLRTFDNILVAGGMLAEKDNAAKHLEKLTDTNSAVVLLESLSNIHSEKFIYNPDNILFSIQENEEASFSPDLLITFGNHFISKQFKQLIRKQKPKEHWHISRSEECIDTFQCLTHQINSAPADFFEALIPSQKDSNSYIELWKNRATETIKLAKAFISNAEYSDLTVYQHLIKHITNTKRIHFGNSTAVRYAQLFLNPNQIDHFCNRGTSGIDGSASTYVGAQLLTNDSGYLILGDLSFLYDSNAYWVEPKPRHMKIVVVNNSGGGIFRFIPGSSDQPEVETLFEAKHNYTAKHLAAHYQLNYYQASNMADLDEQLKQFIADTNSALIEIFTPNETNGAILRNYFSSLKKI